VAVQVRLLGPIEVLAGGRQLDTGSPRQRAILAVLCMDVGRPVPMDTIVDRVWGQSPPARETVYVYISRIRRMLKQAGDGSVVQRSGGYQLSLDPDSVDIQRFDRLVKQADEPVPDDERARLLHQALELWRGAPLADLQWEWAERVRGTWSRKRLDVVIALSAAEVRLGNPGAMVDLLIDLIAENPLIEPLLIALMQALHAADRTAEALACFAAARRRLVNELGVEPGPKLRALHQTLLQNEVRTKMSAPAFEVRSLQAVPAQLPADVAAFTARGAELADLDLLVSDGGPGAVAIRVVSGTAGVGKTALAVHWAHRVAHRFPDGQLYVNLRGYDPGRPMSAEDALARFLGALGVHGVDIPLELDERATRYRTEIAGRRILVVVDNASTVEQVRPLLPGTASCAVVVTSRDRLVGLVARDGARRLDLDLLPVDDAHALLRTLIGSRVEAEPQAAAALAEQCARLPLALRVAAELAAARSTATLAELAVDLADRQRRLDLLDASGDPYVALRSVFGWSLRHLPDGAAEMFRLAGLHPGPDLDDFAAAALADCGVEQARRILRRLARAHLVHPTGPGRYGMHDLLRAYAKGLTVVDMRAVAREAALRRLFDYYLATAAEAMQLLHEADAHRRPHVSTPDTPIPELVDIQSARAWLDVERACLATMAGYAATHGWEPHAVTLSAIMYRYLAGGLTTEALAVHGRGREAAQRVGDARGEAGTLVGLGAAYMQLCRYESATEHFERSLALYRQVGDPVGEAVALANLGALHGRVGRYRSATQCHEQALALFEQLGDTVGEARALASLGILERELGDHEASAHRHRQALALHRQVNNQSGIAYALTNLGFAVARLGRRRKALDHLNQGLALFRQLGNRHGEAHTLDRLGMVHTQFGRPHLATEHHRRAQALFQEVGDGHGQAWALNGLGEAATGAGDVVVAVTHHNEALAIATKLGARDQRARAHTGLSRAYEAAGDRVQAQLHHERVMAEPGADERGRPRPVRRPRTG
jgi:DNA-binding SARP family transcriptional activator/tetratricopeptide (TPR) repeat protein